MAKVNLKLNAERVFGEFLPTVYLKIASVHNHEDAEDLEDIHDVVVKADLSISFTKPDTMTRGEADKFLRENMDHLYLYAWLSPYESLNSQLELGRLRIKDLFDATKVAQATTIDNFTIDNVFFPYVYNEAVEAWNAGEYDYGMDLTDGKSIGSARAMLRDEIESTEIGLTAGGFGYLDWYQFYVLSTDVDALAGLTYATYPTAIADGVDVGSFMDGTSIPNLFFFGPNMMGPWNMPDTVNSETVQQRATTLSEGLKLDITPLEQDTLDSLEDVVTTPGSGGTYPEAAFDTTATFLNHLTRDILGKAGFDNDSSTYVSEGITTTNSFFYDHLSRFFDTTDIQAISDFLNQFKKIRLSDLAVVDGDPAGYSNTDKYGHFNTVTKYDSQGRELLVIENIKLNFIYNSSELERRDVATAILGSIQKLFFIGTVGLDLDYIQAGAFETGETSALLELQQEDRQIHRRLMNNYFGNITYEHVMNNNVVPNPYFTHYIYADDGSPYDGIPIQGLNGQLYAGEPFSNENVISVLRNLIKTYVPQSKGDRRLQNHLNNVRLIIEKYGHTANLIRELKRFQTTFTDKQRRHKSGQFYADFLDILVTVNKKIITQKLVLQKLSVNSTCIDMRPARPLGSTYLRPEPNLDPSYYDVDSADKQDYYIYPTDKASCTNGDSDYIPLNWTKLTRQIEYINAGADGASYETAQVAEKILEAAKEELGTTAMTYAGVDDEYVADFVESEMADINEAYEELGSSIGADQICKNWGYFFFDYEKALYHDSLIANVVDLKKLAVFMNMSVPYEYFHVNTVRVKRFDLRLDFASIAPTRPMQASDFIETRMVTNFHADRQVPGIVKTQHLVLLPPDMNVEMRSVYGKPFVNTVSGTDPDGDQGNTKYSCVKYVHFGVPDNVSTEQMIGGDFSGQGGMVTNLHLQNDFGSYDFQHPGSGGNFVNHIGIGAQFGFFGFKSYRMLAFEIQDYMDDDVALAGTHEDAALQFQQGIEYSGYDDFITGGLGSDSSGNDISNFNPMGENGSWYEIEISVVDKTLEFFSKIYNEFLKPFVDSFEEYVAYAEELCSYNKSNESFNDFFVEAMVEKYVTNTGSALQVEAAELFLRQLEEATLMTGMDSLMGTESETEVDVTGLDMRTYAELVPPWVAGALLSVFVKEVFFNPTPHTSLLKVLSEITTPLSNYDPDSTEPPSQEVIKMMREMYQLSPQKGNIEAVRTFKDRLDPLINVLRLVDEDIKEHVSNITGIPVDAEDFAAQAIESGAVKKFYGAMPIDAPIVPGMASQGYYESSNITGTEAGGSSYSTSPAGFFYDELLGTAPGRSTSTGISRPTVVRGMCAPLVVSMNCVEVGPDPAVENENMNQNQNNNTQSNAASQQAGQVSEQEQAKMQTHSSAKAASGGKTGGGDSGGSTGGGSCVLGGTLIDTIYGQKKVEDIVVGDKVYSYNFETQEYGFYNVNSVMEPNEQNRWVLLTTASGRTLRCTEDHPLYTLDRDNNEIPINECNVGDKVYVVGHRGQLLHDTIKGIVYHDEVVTVYNFEVDEVHSYLSDYVLSHNKTKAGSGGGGRRGSKVGGKHRPKGGGPSGPKGGVKGGYK